MKDHASTEGRATDVAGNPTPNAVVKEAGSVRRMFGAIAPRYDLLNHLLSAGLDVLWRRRAARAAARVLDARNGGGTARALDLCAGTLDLARAVAETTCATTAAGGRAGARRVVALDFSLPMLQRGRRKLRQDEVGRIPLVCGDALSLPLADASFDVVTVAFGVRNFERLHPGLAEAYRVLRPGGSLLVLEFSEPRNALMRGFFSAYNRRVLPVVGRAVSGHPDAYSYLPASIAEFVGAAELADELKEAGFIRVRVRRMSGGMVTLHEALKPERAPALYGTYEP